MVALSAMRSAPSTSVDQFFLPEIRQPPDGSGIATVSASPESPARASLNGPQRIARSSATRRISDSRTSSASAGVLRKIPTIAWCML